MVIRRTNADYDEETQSLIQEFVTAENAALAVKEQQGKAELEACECKDGMFPTGGMGSVSSPVASRRQFLATAAASAAAITTSSAALADAPAGAIDFPVQADPTKEQGRLTNDDGGYGSRSQFESEARWRYPTKTKESSWTMTPL